MKIERDERRFDFHDIGLAIKRAREASGMTQEQLAYIVDRAPRTIMYNEMMVSIQASTPFIRWSQCLIYRWINTFTRPRIAGASAESGLMPC